MSASDSVMEAVGVSKQYPGTLALNNVSFKVLTGKVNILIGENGAGKSTLMRLLAGIEQPTSGEILLEGQPVKLANPREASAKGIGMIHQELNLYPHLTVIQNMFMGQELKNGMVLNSKKCKQIAETVLKRLECEIDPKSKVADLRMGQQQVIEIAKTMVSEGLKVLIMDEPTSSLSKTEVEILFSLIDDLKNQGISIVYISHRMEEIMRVGDYVTILRDGNKVAEAWCKDIDIPWIVSSMVGRERKAGDVEKPKVTPGKELLKCENICLPSPAGGYQLDNVSFELKEGEILGIYGLLGAGRTELLEILMGMRPGYSGEIYFEGKKIKPTSINKQIARGLYLIPEDRKNTGLVHTLDIGKNLTLSSMEKFTSFTGLSKKREDAQADETIENLSIKVADKRLPIFSLSGGNQQKVVIGKGVMTSPKVLLLDEPTRGIDVNAKEEVFKLVFEFAKKGYGVVVVASELGEILRFSDRIMVLSNGKHVATLEGEEATEQSLVAASEVALKHIG